jgi:hypothetical protein
MKTIYLVYLLFTPVIIMVEILMFSTITELLRQKSDMAVLAGVALSSLFLLMNYFLINQLIKTINPKTK